MEKPINKETKIMITREQKPTTESTSHKVSTSEIRERAKV